MQFSFIEKKTKKFNVLQDFHDKGLTIPSCNKIRWHIDTYLHGSVYNSTTIAYDNLKYCKQTSTILPQKPVTVFSFEGQSTRGLNRFVC